MAFLLRMMRHGGITGVGLARGMEVKLLREEAAPAP